MSANFLFLHTSTRFFLASMFLILVPWGNRALSESQALSNIDFQQTLNEHLSSRAVISSLQNSAIPSARVYAIVQNNLDSSLLERSLKITGTEFRFYLAGQQTESQIAILIVSYPNVQTACDMKKRLDSMGGYFKHTKILTRFSSFSFSKEFVITFTENSGNEVVVKLIDEFPGVLKSTFLKKSLD